MRYYLPLRISGHQQDLCELWRKVHNIRSCLESSVSTSLDPSLSIQAWGALSWMWQWRKHSWDMTAFDSLAGTGSDSQKQANPVLPAFIMFANLCISPYTEKKKNFRILGKVTSAWICRFCPGGKWALSHSPQLGEVGRKGSCWGRMLPYLTRFLLCLNLKHLKMLKICCSETGGLAVWCGLSCSLSGRLKRWDCIFPDS